MSNAFDEDALLKRLVSQKGSQETPVPLQIIFVIESVFLPHQLSKTVCNTFFQAINFFKNLRSLFQTERIVNFFL